MSKSKLKHLRDLKTEIKKLERRKNRLSETRLTDHHKIHHLTKLISDLKKEEEMLEKEILEWLENTDLSPKLKEGVNDYYVKGKGWKPVTDRPGCNNFQRDLENNLYNPPK